MSFFPNFLLFLNDNDVGFIVLVDVDAWDEQLVEPLAHRYPFHPNHHNHAITHHLFTHNDTHRLGHRHHHHHHRHYHHHNRYGYVDDDHPDGLDEHRYKYHHHYDGYEYNVDTDGWEYETTSDGRTFTTFVEVTTVIEPGTVVTNPANTGGAKSSTNVGAIVGGVVGGIAGLLLLALIFWFLLRRKRKADLDDHFDGNFDPVRVAASSSSPTHKPSPHHSPSHSVTNAGVGRRASTLLESGTGGRQRVNLDDVAPNMSMVSGAGQGGVYPAVAPYSASVATHTTGASGGAYPSSAGYPAGSSTSPPPHQHHPQMSMSSHGHGYGAGYAGYYGRNEKTVLAPPGEEPSSPYGGVGAEGEGAYYPGGFGPVQGAHPPTSPTHTNSTSLSGGYGQPQYNPYLHGQPAPSDAGSSAYAAGQAPSVTGTTTSASGAPLVPKVHAKEREARGGAHVMNPSVDEEAPGASSGGNRSSGVVQHQDGGRVEEEEDGGEGMKEIPPAYDSIVQGKRA